MVSLHLMLQMVCLNELKGNQKKHAYTKRLFLDYTYGLDRIYTQEEINKAKESPSFEREYNCKYLGQIGNIFHPQDIEYCIERGRLSYNNNDDLTHNTISHSTEKAMGIDPGFGTSKLGCVILEKSNAQIQVLFAEEYEKATFENMVSNILGLLRKYGRSISKIFVDASNPAFIRSLKIAIGEPDDYENIIAEYRAKKWDWKSQMIVIPVAFSTEHKSMLTNMKNLIDNKYVAIHPSHTRLITSLKTATERGESILDKNLTSFDDLFDAARLAFSAFYVKSTENLTNTNSKKQAYIHTLPSSIRR